MGIVEIKEGRTRGCRPALRKEERVWRWKRR